MIGSWKPFLCAGPLFAVNYALVLENWARWGPRRKRQGQVTSPGPNFYNYKCNLRRIKALHRGTVVTILTIVFMLSQVLFITHTSGEVHFDFYHQCKLTQQQLSESPRDCRYETRSYIQRKKFRRSSHKEHVRKIPHRPPICKMYTHSHSNIFLVRPRQFLGTMFQALDIRVVIPYPKS